VLSAQLAPPEDFPSLHQDPPPSLAESHVGWGGETPTARELWAQARGGLLQAGKLARNAGQKGWTKSKSAAFVMSAALRERLERVSEEAQAGAPAPETSSPSIPDQPTPGEAEDTFAPSPTNAPSETDQARASDGVKKPRAKSNVVALPVVLLARGAKSLAAPLAACAAAVLVYQAGSHFLGSAADIGLSKGAPNVPDLGELEPNADQTPDSAPAASKSVSAPAGGPTPMQVELTKMPDGLSWPGKGLIEVVTAEDELIYVDGVFTGRGPLRRIPVAPGEHDLRIKQNGAERTGQVKVELDRCTRAVFAQNP
jgi:hypothetical protein